MYPSSHQADLSCADRVVSPLGAATDDAAPYDLGQVLRRCMGRLDLAERLLANFELRFPKEIEQLEQYLADQNAPRVALLAHQLKGASANMSAPFLEQLLHEIEELARGNSLTDIQEKMCQLQIEWQRFVECRQLTTTRP